MVPLIKTLLQWEFVVTTMVIFFSVHTIQRLSQQKLLDIVKIAFLWVTRESTEYFQSISSHLYISYWFCYVTLGRARTMYRELKFTVYIRDTSCKMHWMYLESTEGVRAWVSFPHKIPNLRWVYLQVLFSVPRCRPHSFGAHQLPYRIAGSRFRGTAPGYGSYERWLDRRCESKGARG